MAAHQAPPSLGFSRQEHWSGLPFPSPMHESEKRQTLTDIKGETDSNTIIVGDFSTTLTLMGRPSKQKIKKETQVLNHTLDEMDLIDIFSSFHPNTKNTPSSQVHMEHILQDRPYLGSQIKPQ